MFRSLRSINHQVVGPVSSLFEMIRENKLGEEQGKVLRTAGEDKSPKEKSPESLSNR